MSANIENCNLMASYKYKWVTGVWNWSEREVNFLKPFCLKPTLYIRASKRKLSPYNLASKWNIFSFWIYHWARLKHVYPLSLVWYWERTLYYKMLNQPASMRSDLVPLFALLFNHTNGMLSLLFESKNRQIICKLWANKITKIFGY